MSFQDVLPNAVCGTCHERKRPAIIRHQHAQWWDSILGAYAKCPDCGNVFEPGTWNPESEDAEFVEALDRNFDPTELYGTSMVEKIHEKLVEDK